MNEQQKQLIKSLVIVSADQPPIPNTSEILATYGAHTTDVHQFGLSVLREAAEKQDGEEFAYAWILCSALKAFDETYVDLLIELSAADWHKKHEDIALTLQQLKSPKAVDALYYLTQWLPEYMDYDEENRALARKALFALGDTPGDEAKNTVQKLLQDNNPKIREFAQEQIDRQTN